MPSPRNDCVDPHAGVQGHYVVALRSADLRELTATEPLPTSLPLFFDGLKDADGVDDRGGAVRAPTWPGQYVPAFERGGSTFAGWSVAGVVGVDLLLVARGPTWSTPERHRHHRAGSAVGGVAVAGDPRT
jgi:hypothetical protein